MSYHNFLEIIVLLYHIRICARASSMVTSKMALRSLKVGTHNPSLLVNW